MLLLTVKLGLVSNYAVAVKLAGPCNICSHYDDIQLWQENYEECLDDFPMQLDDL